MEVYVDLTLCLLVWSAEKLKLQTVSDPDQDRLYGTKLFDTLLVFPKEFFRKSSLWKKSADDNKSIKSYPAWKDEEPYLVVLFQGLKVKEDPILILWNPHHRRLKIFIV